MLNFYVLPRTQEGSAAATLSASTLALNAEAHIVVGLPVRIKIPSINVNAPIEQVGVAVDGVMGVPKGPDGAGWFQFGPRPGEKGSAVIAGHFGWKNNIPAVFDDLRKVQKGDKIYVEDDAGIATVFVVRELRTYTEREDASGVFSSSDGIAHLNLVTCEGVWDPISKSYSNRLVVFADKE
jgi:LPXTG-site transpeptidase (sortase) family protein